MGLCSTARGFQLMTCQSAMKPEAARKRAASTCHCSREKTMAAMPAASCQWPLSRCLGMSSPATAREAKNGVTRRATSRAMTAMASMPVRKKSMMRS